MGEAGPVAAETAAAAKAGPRGRRRSGARIGAIVVLVLAGLFLGLGVVGLALTGKDIRLPVWVVAEVEARINADLAPALGGGSLSVGDIDVMVDEGFVPRVRLQDLRLLRPGGRALVVLPEARVVFDPVSATQGLLRLRSLSISGAQLSVARLSDGRFDFTFGVGTELPPIAGLDELFALVDRAFAQPALSRLALVEAEALALTVEDRRTGKLWQIGDGRFTLQNREADLAGELAFTLAQQGRDPAQAVVAVVAGKGAGTARLTAKVNRVAAADLAAQSAPLAWLGVLDAPISGQVAATIDGQGLAAFDGSLVIGEGALRPTPGATPIAFDRAEMDLSYDPQSGRIGVGRLAVQSDSLRLSAAGQGFLLGPGGARMAGPLKGELPAAFLGQLQLDEVMVDPEGLFEAPVRFSEGALDIRLALDPFRIDVGQLSLVEAGERLDARGSLGADARGWRTSLDFAIDSIGVDRLLQLWPVGSVPRTRAWLVDNVHAGQLFDVNAALRLQPGAAPVLALDYEFRDTEVRFVRSLPPITGAWGHAVIENLAYTLVLDRGLVTPPEGGAIVLESGVFRVDDITRKPAQGQFDMQTDSSLTAALSLLDQPPFQFLTKAGRPVDLGEGRARLRTSLSLPLRKGVLPKDVTYHVEGVLSGVSSAVLVPGKTITAETLQLEADPSGLTIRGPGSLGAVPFDVVYRQPFGPEAGGRASIEGQVTLSPAAVEEFNLGLPAGSVFGAAPAEVRVDLQRGAPGRLDLRSDLAGLGLAVPQIGWRKGPDAPGRLEVEAVLSSPPVVERLALSGGGMESGEGRVTLRPGGGLDEAAFAQVRLNGWLDGAVRLTGQGPGKPPAVALEGGTVTLQRLAGAGLGGGPAVPGAGVPITVRLDRLAVSGGIALTDLRGAFTTRGGFNGDFTALVNGKARVRGEVVPGGGGTAVRILSDDAGAALAAAGIFGSAAGGALEATLTPRRGADDYEGAVTLRDFRVRDANVLAELLNAVSVVGLLDQLNGEGIAFSTAEAKLRLSPAQVRIIGGSAIGASLGVTLEGVYRSADKAIDLQGVISPIYLVNGIGGILTRRGEGVIGFDYALKGTSDRPVVSVNPLSLLTPGVFRELFRRPMPKLGESGG